MPEPTTLNELIDELESVREEHGGETVVKSYNRVDTDVWTSDGVPVIIQDTYGETEILVGKDIR